MCDEIISRRRTEELEHEKKERIIRDLEKNRNAYTMSYLKVIGITPDDLKGEIRDSKGNVRDDVLRSWDRHERDRPASKITPIPQGNVEVYFWGTFGSGKTSVIASFLNKALSMGILQTQRGSELQSLIQMLDLFYSEPSLPAVRFPPADDSDSVQWIPFLLSDSMGVNTGFAIMEVNYSVFYSISAILSGETLDVWHKKTYNLTLNYLNNKDNPKYHFFVIDSQPFACYNQQYLLQTIEYMYREGIFNRTTKGIGIIVTKCDLLSPNREEWLGLSMEIMEREYGQFVSRLKEILRVTGKHDVSIPIIPFSVGEVFFKQLFIPNLETAAVLVDLLRKYGSQSRHSNQWLDRIFRRK